MNVYVSGQIKYNYFENQVGALVVPDFKMIIIQSHDFIVIIV